MDRCRSWPFSLYQYFCLKFVATPSYMTQPTMVLDGGITFYNFHYFYFSPISAFIGFIVVCIIHSSTNICINHITNGFYPHRLPAMLFIRSMDLHNHYRIKYSPLFFHFRKSHTSPCLFLSIFGRFSFMMVNL